MYKNIYICNISVCFEDIARNVIDQWTHGYSTVVLLEAVVSIVVHKNTSNI